MRGACLLLLGLAACRTTLVEERVQKISVDTDPKEAWVSVEDSTGTRVVGTSPIEVQRPYSVTKEGFDPRCWLWPWGGVGLAVAGLVTGSVVGWSDSSGLKGGSVAGATAATLGGITALAGALVCGVGQAHEGEVVRAKQERVRVIASRDGFLDVARVLQSPGADETVRLQLTPRALGAPPGEPKAAPGPPVRPARPIVAVLDVEDSTGRASSRAIEQLTDYLATRLAESGYQVVPRDRVRSELMRSKAEGYRPCFDESCQIELGKAVAAEKSLATKLLGLGEACTLTSTLYDLRLEVAERAALARTDCDSRALVGGIDRLVSELR
jgi:hypothetical protein